MFLVRWEGEAPPDKAEWLAAVRQALADEVGIYRVRFHREPAGWHFDLECRSEAGSEQPTVRNASESVALNVYARLAESGKPLDPDWDPLAPTPSEPPVRGEAVVASEAVEEVAPVEPAAATLSAGAPPPQDGPEAEDPAREVEPPPTGRAGPWPTLRVASGRLATLGLALAAGWLAWDRFRTPATSPPATLSAEALSAQERLRQLEAVVAQLRKEKLETASPAPVTASPAPRAGATAAPPRPRATPVGTVAPGTLATPTPAVVGAPPTLASRPPPALETPTPPTTVLATPPTTTPAPPPAGPPTEPEAEAPAPVEPGAVVDLADPGLTRPVLVTQGQPRYPPLALRRGIEGTVVVSLLVDETGAVAEASVVRASPRGMGFEDAATRYVKSRRYRPATRGGVPVRVRLEVAVEFRRPGSR